MRIAARSHRNTMRPHLMFSALSVDQDLSLKHNQSLVQVWVGVKRGRLALRHPVFHQQERSVGLLSGRLPDVHTSACEPEALPLSLPADDRPCSAHYLLLSSTLPIKSNCRSRTEVWIWQKSVIFAIRIWAERERLLIREMNKRLPHEA